MSEFFRLYSDWQESHAGILLTGDYGADRMCYSLWYFAVEREFEADEESVQAYISAYHSLLSIVLRPQLMEIQNMIGIPIVSEATRELGNTVLDIGG